MFSAFGVLYTTSSESLAKERIVKVLTEELEAKGYKAVPKNKTDFYVVFHAHVTDKSQIVTVYKVMGVSYYGYNYYGYRHPYRYNGGTAVVPVYRQIPTREAPKKVTVLLTFRLIRGAFTVAFRPRRTCGKENLPGQSHP